MNLLRALNRLWTKPQPAELTRPLRLPYDPRLQHRPLARGLTPDALHAILDTAALGEAGDYLTLAEEMEERSPAYAAVLGTRKRAVLGLARSVEAASDSAHDVELRDAVETCLVKPPHLNRLLTYLLDALGKGYSAVEIDWDTTASPWKPVNYHWRDPRHFRYDRATGQTLQTITARWGEGEPLPPMRYVVHEPRIKMGLPIRGGLARLAAITELCRHLALESWLAFAESYGAPVRIAKADDRFFPEDATERAAYVEDLQAKLQSLLGADACAVLPKSVDMELQAGPIGGAEVYERLVQHCEKSLSKAILGRSDAADATSGQLGGQDYAGDVRRDILESDAAELSETLNAQLVRPFVDLNWGPQPAYPIIRLSVPDPEDLVGLVDLLAKLVPLGLKVEQSVIRDKWGLPDPEPDAELLGAPTTPDIAAHPASGGRESPVSVSAADPAAVPEKQGADAPRSPEQKQGADVPRSPDSRAQNRVAGTLTADPVEPFVSRLGREADPLLEALLEPVRQALNASGDLMTFREALLTLYPDLDPSAFAALMGQALAVADAAGRFDVLPPERLAPARNAVTPAPQPISIEFSPKIHVANPPWPDQPPPQVTVQTPEVIINNAVHVPTAPPPTIHVTAAPPTIQVQPAEVAVQLNLPPRKTETLVERDPAGQIVRATQIETDLETPDTGEPNP